MSVGLFNNDILFLQRLLAVSGFYTKRPNGKWSTEVEDAEKVFLARYEQIKTQSGEFDARTEGCIKALLPSAQIKAREFMNALKEQPLTYRIISGTRTYAEQNALFAKRPKVTNARGGQSNHNFGIAWDIGIFENGKYYTGSNKKEDKAYSDLGALAKPAVTGLEWGAIGGLCRQASLSAGTGMSVRQVSELFERGKPYV